jgi:hypothetical protein
MHGTAPALLVKAIVPLIAKNHFADRCTAAP